VLQQATLRRANEILTRSRELGLVSDWDDQPTQKPGDFACLIVAASMILPPGGSVETGVFRGGTSGPLIMCASPETFHVAIDPYGLPSQSYPYPDLGYGNWPAARSTIATLAALAEKHGVTLCHYVMDARTFIHADLLQHPASFRIVHLDGDHSKAAVIEELEYFRRRVAAPAIFILDDHDENFPGVAEAMESSAAEGLLPIFHNQYPYPGATHHCGFSAWLHCA
jgi:hypothetical protein